MGILSSMLTRATHRKDEAVAALAKLTEEERAALEAAAGQGFDFIQNERLAKYRDEIIGKEFEAEYRKRLEAEHPELTSDPVRKELYQVRKRLEDSENAARRAKLEAIAIRELGEYNGLIPVESVFGADEDETKARAVEYRDKIAATIGEATKKAAEAEAAKYNLTTPPAATGSAIGTNPWTRAGLNLTKQAEIRRADPAKAAALEAAAKAETH